MIKIHIHNYEAFLLDAAEGNLTGEQQLALDMFLIEHPELHIDTNEITEAIYDSEHIIYADKKHLKKTHTDLVTEEQFINYIENTLNTEEKLILEKSCSLNSALASELQLFKNTIAVADATIVFEPKESLKRKSKFIWFNFSANQFAAAASVALLILLYVVWPSKPQKITSNKYATNSHKLKIFVKPVNTIAQVTNSKTSHKKNKIYKHLNTKPLVQSSSTFITTSPHIAQPVIHLSVNDTLSKLVIEESTSRNNPDKETVVASSSPHKTTVETVIESEDEGLVEPQKKGFWAMAGKTLKGLNKVGLKSVDGNEDVQSKSSVYDLTLGALSITHKSN